MKTLKKVFLYVAIAMAATFSACNKDDDNSVHGAYSNGIFIVNEGQYSGGTGTITYFNPDSNLVKQNIFELENGRPLGNIAQSMTIFNGKAYIAVNNAQKVEVADAATFKSTGTIFGLANPAQFLGINDKVGYVSDWDGSVKVVDLATNTITKTITVGTGPDMMVKTSKYVFVANAGGFSIDSTVSIIDYALNQVVKTIKVGDAPAGMVADSKGKIWVICKGKGFSGWPAAGDTPGKIIRIDPASLAVDYTYSFSSTGDHPEKLVIDKTGTVLYFLFNSGIYSFNTAAASPVPQKLISRYFYSMGYENKTGYLYASDPKNYTNAGIVLRIKASDGSVVDSVQAGIVPRWFTFTE
jgi:YVTN family beta-propeller protein